MVEKWGGVPLFGKSWVPIKHNVAGALPPDLKTLQIHQNTPLQAKNSFFFCGGPLSSRPQPSLFDLPLNCSQIYAYGFLE